MNTAQQRVWNTAVWVTAILGVFLVAITIKEFKSIAYVGKSDQVVNTITVNAEGDTVAVPDIATFSFTVSETAKAVADAQSAATTKINAALDAVRAGGVADKDIQTTSYNINPDYEYSSGICTPNGCPPSKQTLTGYDVSETIQVKVRDLSKAGALFASIGSLGVQNVDGLSFSVDDMDAVEAQARSAAITKAQAKADELAKELGVTLVRITSFSDNNNYPGPIAYGMASDSMSIKAIPAAAPQIPTGEQKITSNVTITYEIR